MARWCSLALTASLCLWVAQAHPAPAPASSTQDTMVVTKVDDTDATTESQAPSTEGPAPPVKLTQMDVSSEVSLRYAHTAVVTRVRNPASRPQETTFHVLLPETAFISGFTMTLDGKSYKAYVKEKDEAKKIYDKAVSQGVSTALVSAKARDSNHFTVSVNIEPKTDATFNLTYEEMLVRRNGVYNHAINLHPGTLVPQLTVKVHIKEGQSITTLRVPEVRTGNEVDANENDAQNSQAVIERGADGREATITFSPDLEEQTRLMAVYAEKSRDSRQNTGYRFRSIDDDNSKDVGVLGQFVVQYDVDRSTNGEVLVNNGYFVHFFAPNLPPLPKHVVFVLDTSGSMSGHKIDQLQQAMRSILSDLNPGDYFNIIEFDSTVKVHDLSEADSPDTSSKHYYFGYQADENVSLKKPSPATPTNVEKAKTIIGRLTAAGGTNIYKAMTTAIDIVNRGINPPAEGAPITEAGETPTPTTEAPTTLSLSSEDAPRPEPIIIFLTDGDPTVGETNTQRIINHVSEKNYGDNKATVFSLAFGEDADRTFLRKLSLRNEGFMRHIYEAADAALQLRDFYRQVSSPLLSNVRFTYPPEQVKEDSLTRHKFRTFYLGGEAVVAGQLLTDQPIDFEPTIEGFGYIDDSKKRKTYRLKPKASASTEDLPLERLWAYLTIKQLLDARDAADTDEERNAPKEKALAIALKYQFVTPLTSLVVVKPNATNAVDAESVDKPDVPIAYPHVANGFARPSYNYLSLNRGAAGIAPLSISFDEPSGSLSNNDIKSKTMARTTSRSRKPLDGPMMRFGSSSVLSSQRSFISAMARPSFAYSHHSSGGHGAYGPPGGAAYFATQNLQPAVDRIVGGQQLLSADVLEEAEAEEDNTRVDFDSTVQLITSTVPPRPPPTTSSTTTSSPLTLYRLENFSWTQSLINADRDSIVFRHTNGTDISLKLAKESKDEPAGPGEECTPSTAGGAGACTYLTQCAAARALTAHTYTQHYCSRDGYAGVCCPKANDEQSATTEEVTSASALDI